MIFGKSREEEIRSPFSFGIFLCGILNLVLIKDRGQIPLERFSRTTESSLSGGLRFNEKEVDIVVTVFAHEASG